MNALSLHQILGTENTRKLRAGAALSTVWASFFTTFLENEQSEFLNALVQIAEDPHEYLAAVQWATATEVFEALGWSTTERTDIGRAHAIVNILDDAGLVRKRLAMGGLAGARARPPIEGSCSPHSSSQPNGSSA